MEYIILGLVAVGFGYAIYMSMNKKPTPPVDKEKIREEINAITDIEELRLYAKNHGVDPYVIQRGSFETIKNSLYAMYNLN